MLMRTSVRRSTLRVTACCVSTGMPPSPSTTVISTASRSSTAASTVFMVQNVSSRRAWRVASRVSTSIGSSGSWAHLTENTASTSGHDAFAPERATSSWGFATFKSSIFLAWSASIRATTSRREGLPSPISPPAKKIPKAEVAISPTMQMTTTTAAPAPPTAPSAACIERKARAAMRAKASAPSFADRARRRAPLAFAEAPPFAAAALDAMRRRPALAALLLTVSPT